MRKKCRGEIEDQATGRPEPGDREQAVESGRPRKPGEAEKQGGQQLKKAGFLVDHYQKETSEMQ
jgi:hypothetical protein